MLNVDTEKEGKEIEIAKETQRLNWYAMSRFTTPIEPRSLT